MILTLADLIAQAESSNNKFAIRYEPTHKPSLTFVSRMMAFAKCSRDTAIVLCSSSWGLYQIMGDELMALGLPFSPIYYCNDTALQYSYFNEVLNEKGLAAYTLDNIINNEDDRLHFAIKYNGPGQPEVYAQYLLDTYNKNK